jgi:hypothetical protein
MFRRIYFSIQYRYCMVNAYLASWRGDGIAVANYKEEARWWKREYKECL